MEHQASVARARELRQNLSSAELLVWTELKQRPFGLKFRRQERCGPYFLDFYCAPARLAVEIDGIQHEGDTAARRDQRRDAWVARRGIHTVRISAYDVFKALSGVLDFICRAAFERIDERRRR